MWFTFCSQSRPNDLSAGAQPEFPDSIQQFAQLYVQCRRQPVHNGDRRITRTTFQIADIGAMNIRAECKLFLRPAFLLTQATKITGKALRDIHGGTVPFMSTINLQTISDIRA